MTKWDWTTYARRLPPREKTELASALTIAWRSGGIFELRRFVGATPAQFSFINHCRLAFNLSGVVQALAAEGQSPFGLGFPFPWDGVRDDIGSSKCSTLSRSICHFLERMSTLDTSTTEAIAAQAARDVVTEINDSNQLHAICAAYLQDTESLGIANLFNTIRHLASRQIVPIDYTSQHHFSGDQDLLFIGIGAGADYAPWELPDINELGALCDMIDSRSQSRQVRDATIVLQYYPTESARDAVRIIRSFCSCITRVGSEHPSTLVLWSRVRQLLDSWGLSDFQKVMSYQEYDDYESNPEVAVRDALRIFRHS